MTGRSVLSDRFARGEISEDEYRDRLATLHESTSPPRSRPVRTAVALVIIGLVGIIGSAIWTATTSSGWMGDMMGGGMGSMMQSGATERSADPPDRGAATTRVVARDFSFSPAEISLRAGETVNVELTNEGHMFHTFTLPELDFDLRARSGDSIAGALTAREPGTYELVCAVPEHAEMGMRGRILVSDE